MLRFVRLSLFTATLVLSVTTVAIAQTREAPIDDVEVVTDANGVGVIVGGALPNACTELGDPVQTVERNTIDISVPVIRRTGGVCTQAIVLFEEMLRVDVSALTPGEYTVSVNGIEDTFELTQSMIDAQMNAIPESSSEVDDGQMETNLGGGSTAFVERAEIRLGADNGVNVLVSGNLPDGCSVLVGYSQVNGAQGIEIALLATRPPDAVCTLALVPFEESFPLETAGLAEGVYSVTVNGVASPPFIWEGGTPGADSQCVTAGDEGLVRNFADGYCLRFPVGYNVEAPQPGWLVLSPSEDGTLPVVTITANADDTRTLEEIAAEYGEVAFDDTQIGGEPALVTSAFPETGGWQAFVSHNEILYTISAQTFEETADDSILSSLIDSFAFTDHVPLA